MYQQTLNKLQITTTKVTPKIKITCPIFSPTPKIIYYIIPAQPPKIKIKLIMQHYFQY